jgi:hypothetical protein
LAPPRLLFPELPRLLLPLLGPLRKVLSPGFAWDLLPALNLGFDDDGEEAEEPVLGFGFGLGFGLGLGLSSVLVAFFSGASDFDFSKYLFNSLISSSSKGLNSPS